MASKINFLKQSLSFCRTLGWTRIVNREEHVTDLLSSKWRGALIDATTNYLRMILSLTEGLLKFQK